MVSTPAQYHGGAPRSILMKMQFPCFEAAVMQWRVAQSGVLLALWILGAAGNAFSQPAAPGAEAIALQEFSRSLEGLAQKAGPAIVQVVAAGYGPLTEGEAIRGVLARRRTGGSGVILDPNGYIVTNAHVVEGAERVQVLLSIASENGAPGDSILRPQPSLREAAIAGVDLETDLAVLKVEEKNLPFLELGDSDELRQGQLVFAFGSPRGLENSFTMGVVSSVARQLEPEDTMIYIQTDTAINPGNSGGPLLDAAGRVMGINTLIFSQSGGNEGLGFAAPSNIVRTVFEQIRATGSVRRGQIGIHAQTITPVLAAGLGLGRAWGAVIADVVPGGPAEIAGVEAGDVVLTMDGKVIENARQLLVNLYQRKIGDVVYLEVLRGTERKTIRVAALEQPDDMGRLAPLVSREEHLIEKLGVLGIAIDRDIAAMLPPLRSPGGVIVAARVADGPPWNALFQPGDVIHAVNQTATTSLRELREALDQFAPGDPVVFQLERLGRMQFLPVHWE